MNKKMNFMGFFTLTAAMLMSSDEYPAFAQSGLLLIGYLILAGLIWFLPVALCSAELATIDGNEDGGVFTWVKNVLGLRWGFMAVFFQWLQITVNFITMIYFIIGSLSYVLHLNILNTNPELKELCFLIIYWGMTLWQMGGIYKTEKLVDFSFYLGIILPAVFLLLLGVFYFVTNGNVAFNYHLHYNLHQLTHNTSIATIVPYILAFTGIEASASYINDLEKPKYNYPLAILTLVVFAIIIDSLGGISVAAVIPLRHLTLNQGVIQAVSNMFTGKLKLLSWLVYPIGLLMSFGMIGEISSWIVGPVKSLFVTAEDGILPRYFMQINKNNVPVRLVILQGIIVSIISFLLTVVFGGSNNAYQMAMALTVMLYIITYILIFVTYLTQINRKNKTTRTFQIPGKRFVQYFVGGLGLISSVAVLFSTVLPSQHMKSMKPIMYTIIMSLFLAVIVIITDLIYEYGIRKIESKEYNWEFKHPSKISFQKSVFLQGRMKHDLKLIDDDISKYVHQESKNNDKK